jgi:hypothetical protein
MPIGEQIIINCLNEGLRRPEYGVEEVAALIMARLGAAGLLATADEIAARIERETPQSDL